MTVGDQTYNCVTDGPFAGQVMAYDCAKYGLHCRSRDFHNGVFVNGTADPGLMFAEAYTPNAVRELQVISECDQYRRKLESGPHGALHGAIGGVRGMGASTSPNGQFQMSCISFSWFLIDLQSQSSSAILRSTTYRLYSSSKTRAPALCPMLVTGSRRQQTVRNRPRLPWVTYCPCLVSQTIYRSSAQRTDRVNYLAIPIDSQVISS